MLTGMKPDARVFMIDTGVLFPETLETWRKFEQRFGAHVEVVDACSPTTPSLRARRSRRPPGTSRRPQISPPA